jgi:hypothetical protein
VPAERAPSEIPTDRIEVPREPTSGAKADSDAQVETPAKEGTP